MQLKPSTDGTLGSPVFFLILLVLAVVIAYANSVGNGFVWLDRTEIVEGGYRILSKEDARSVWVTSLDEYQFRNHGGVRAGSGYWRPVYALSITADWALFGNNPFWYHLENVLLHGLCCVSLFLLGLRLLPQTRDAVPIAGLATLLFAVHPLGTQSVTWISGRKDLLCSLFGVWSLLAGLYGLQSRRPGVRCSGVAASLTFWLLAAGCKELALVVPAIATTVVVAGRGSDRLPFFREGLVWLAVLWCGAGGLWLFRASIGLTGLNAAWPSDSLATNLLTLSALWWHFVLRVFWPFPPMLSDRWMLVDGSAPAAAWLLALAIPLIVLLCGWWIWKRRAPALALAWYLIWMLPASGLVPLRHWRAERYLYPASWGLLLLAVWLSWRWIARNRLWMPRLVAGVWVLAAGGLATATVLENRYWKDDLTLFAHAVEQDPLYAEGQTALAAAWLEEGEAEAAVRHSALADRARQQPGSLSYCSPLILHANWGHALYQLGRIDEAQQQFGQALRVQPDNALMHYQLGVCVVAQDTSTEGLQRARDHFRKAVENDPKHAPSIGNLGFVELQLGNLHASVTILQPLIDVKAATSTDLRNYASAQLAIALQSRESSASAAAASLERAGAAFETLVSGGDATAQDWAKLAWVRLLSGDRARAEAALEEGRGLDPDDSLVRLIGAKLRAARR
ncbi:tetratricopeptide repeat protein [Maioricimonas rarisocia]|nr:tetratricopeptide repeat protein [Maioricimonas rarisocia]